MRKRVPANCVQGPILTERGFTVATFAASVATFAVIFAATHKPLTVRTVIIERQAVAMLAPIPPTQSADAEAADYAARVIAADRAANEEKATSVLSGQGADYFQPDMIAGKGKASKGPRKVFGRAVNSKP